MSQQTVQFISMAILLLGMLALIGVWLSMRRQPASRGALRAVGRYSDEDEDPKGIEQPTVAEAIETRAEAIRKHKREKRKEPTIEEQLFMAGKFSARDRASFHRKRKLAPMIFGGLGLLVGFALGSFETGLLGAVLGVILGVYIPIVVLRKWVERHHEELSYHLPLLIEQIAIGVSSSLDIGPCLTQVVDMADERNSHSAATRMLKYALFYVKSGVSLEEALVEIGKSSRHPDFKHALLALSQVAKFGGEISKQLQDLAEAASSQREAKVEAQIRKLELKASGPVALVFVGYMALLGLGIAAQAMKDF